VTTKTTTTKSAGKLLAVSMAAMQRHCLMEHIQGYTGSHCMVPLGKCPCYIALAATMVIKIGGKHKNTNKTQLLASNFGTHQSLVVYENFIPPNGPSTQLINATSCVKM
jgi:hypothetical protein